MPRARARPDPTARLRRIERALAMLRASVLPPALARLVRGTRERRLEPLALLADAHALWPEHPAIPMWTFEAAVAAREPAAAARALRAARRLGAGRVPLVLARARLLELRGREQVARRLLARALRRHPRDARIVQSLVALSS